MLMRTPIPDTLKRILIIRMSSIGDIILASPVVRQLRRKYPQAQIDFLVRRDYCDLVRYNPHLSTILELDTGSGRGALVQLKRTIRHAGYDVIVDLHRNLRSSYLCRFFGRPPVLKVNKNLLIRFLLVYFDINLYRRFYSEPLSVAEKYRRAAAPLGISSGDLQLEIYLPPAVQEKGRALWAELAKKDLRVVMAPGARHFTKRWPSGYYAELITAIHRRWGWGTLLVGGPQEVSVIADIQARVAPAILENLAGQLSLLETIAVIQQAPLFISNDSGLMHAAAALGKPQIAIFGSTTRELGFFPLNPNAIIAENNALSCRPCSHIGRASCPKKHFKCMLAVTPGEVLDSCRQLRQSGIIAGR